jgi:septal ring factor EnvC (AmiA/AmiB activator)
METDVLSIAEKKKLYELLKKELKIEKSRLSKYETKRAEISDRIYKAEQELAVTEARDPIKFSTEPNSLFKTITLNVLPKELGTYYSGNSNRSQHELFVEFVNNLKAHIVTMEGIMASADIIKISADYSNNISFFTAPDEKRTISSGIKRKQEAIEYKMEELDRLYSELENIDFQIKKYKDQLEQGSK